MKQGKLIVIEGNDGSGKGTQLKLLIDYLKKKNIPFEQFDFPQYEKTFFGNLVRRFLSGELGRVEKVSPYLAALPFAADRWQVKDKIKAALNDGKIVICNRYTPSIVYQLVKVAPAKRREFLQWGKELEYQVFGLPKEDWVIFLYLPFNFAQKLIEKRGRGKDEYEKNVAYLKKVEKLYLWLCEKEKNWIKIDCFLKDKILCPQTIHQKILAILKEKAVLP